MAPFVTVYFKNWRDEFFQPRVKVNGMGLDRWNTDIIKEQNGNVVKHRYLWGIRNCYPCFGEVWDLTRLRIYSEAVGLNTLQIPRNFEDPEHDSNEYKEWKAQ